MAFICKAEGSSPALEYDELARLVRDAQAGDPVAAVQLARLPATEQRLAVSVFKAYGGKVGKPSRPKVRKAGKGKQGAPAVPALRASLTADLASYDPMVREAARKALEEL